MVSVPGWQHRLCIIIAAATAVLVSDVNNDYHHKVHARAGGYSGQPVDIKEECVSVPGLQHRLCMAWRQDNAGPHSPEEVLLLHK